MLRTAESLPSPATKISISSGKGGSLANPALYNDLLSSRGFYRKNGDVANYLESSKAYNLNPHKRMATLIVAAPPPFVFRKEGIAGIPVVEEPAKPRGGVLRVAGAEPLYRMMTSSSPRRASTSLRDLTLELSWPGVVASRSGRSSARSRPSSSPRNADTPLPNIPNLPGEASRDHAEVRRSLSRVGRVPRPSTAISITYKPNDIRARSAKAPSATDIDDALKQVRDELEKFEQNMKR
jgi:hypothetical protein